MSEQNGEPGQRQSKAAAVIEALKASKQRNRQLAAERAERIKFCADYAKYGAPSGMTEEEFSEVWALRGRKRMSRNGSLKDAYAVWVDATRKRLSRPKRKSAVLIGLSADEIREHRRPQNAEAQRKRRVRQKCPSIPALAPPPLSDDPELIERLVASLRAAEEAERRADAALK